jgi:Zn-dependent protease with chaperone function
MECTFLDREGIEVTVDFDPQLFVFALGADVRAFIDEDDPNKYYIWANSAARGLLDEVEMEAVLWHELGHIYHRHIQPDTVVAGRLKVKLALWQSRRHERQADSFVPKGYRRELVSALRKLDAHNNRYNPFTIKMGAISTRINELNATHPNTTRRARRLGVYGV